MLKILKHLRPKDLLFILISVGLIVLQVWLDLELPDYIKQITSAVQTPGSTIKDILVPGGYMLACALLSALSAVIVGFFAAKVAASFAKRLRQMVFDKVESFSMEEISRFSTASLITRSTNDVTQIQMLIAMGLQVTIKAPILAVWAVIKILGKSWQWSAMTAGAVGILLILIVIIVVFAMPKFKKIQTLTDNLNRVTRENLIGIRVVRAYNAEGFQQGNFDHANGELTDNYLTATRTMAVMNPGMSIIMNGLSLAIYWIGAYIINATAIVNRGNVYGDMVVFSSYAMQIIMAFMMLAMIFIMLPRAIVSAKRINEVLDTVPTITDRVASVPETAMKGEVEFKDVSFKYPGAEEYVLKNISFKAAKGETVAFIGSTGSGKSTLINLIPRFYDASEGEVLIDGVDVRDYPQKQLHAKLGYVPQRGVLFSGTVESNVNYGNNGDLGTVKRAVEVAQAKGFVEQMEGEYQAPIAQGGTNVSGGQKQRLSIARAVARDPEIYIFDDSFSALDYKTDRVLRAALKKETSEATSLIVAQRIGTIKSADRILVLDHGEMVGIGTHDELMKNCSVYQEIAYSQLSKEELANG